MDSLHSAATPEEIQDEQTRLRRLRLLVDLTAGVLAQEPDLTLESAIDWIERAEEAAAVLFPGSGETFDLLIRPRLSRIVSERFPTSPVSVH